MRSIIVVLAFSILACDSSDASKDQPLAIPAGDDGRPALAPPDGTTSGDVAGGERASVAVAWREQLATARVRYESMKAHAGEKGEAVGASTDRLMQKTKDEIDAAQTKLEKADEVAANELGGFEKEMARDLEAIESDLRALAESIAGDKSAAASLEVEEDHE